MKPASRLRPAALLAFCYLSVQSALRLALALAHGPDAGIGAVDLPGILARGVVNDAVETIYLVGPFAALLLLLPTRWARRRALQWATSLTLATGTAVFVFLAVVEWYFFAEFDARFNLVAFDYLMYPTEVIGDVRAEYPLGVVSALAAATGFAVLLLARTHVAAALAAPASRSSRAAALAASFVAGTLAAVAYPTDALSRSGNRLADELVQNGHSSFFRAARTSEIEYGAYYDTRPTQANLDVLTRRLRAGGGRFVDLNVGRLDREFPADPKGLGPLNVVLVVGESFGAEFSRLYGSAEDLTPNFDRLAAQGVWFSRAYASGTRTVRGLEALTTSLPPIPTVSILRRPGSEGISTWGGVLHGLGYRTSFLYGGYGYFDNMNHFYASNGFQVLDRSAIDSVRFENIWGVSDEDLFDLALRHFDDEHARGSPFFAVVMTTSNHKPFTFRAGLEHLGIPEHGGGRAAGVRYADYALGYFVEQAKRHAWFDDTLFVFVADHGARVYGRQDIPLRTYEIPLLLYAPKHLAPRRVDTPTGQIDVAPTVMGVLGLAYRAPFFGRDVLKHPEGESVLVFNHNHDVALLSDDRMVVLGLNGRVDFLTYDRERNTYRPRAADPELEDLAVAYYQTASELFRAHRY